MSSNDGLFSQLYCIEYDKNWKRKDNNMSQLIKSIRIESHLCYLYSARSHKSR
jgi:hypothetical protein